MTLDVCCVPRCDRQASLAWWQHWVVLKQQRRQRLDDSCLHMHGFKAHRFLAGWHGRVQRKAQLQELQQHGLRLGQRTLQRTAIRGWHRRCELQRWRDAVTAAVAAAGSKRRLAMGWLAWLDYVARRQQQQAVSQEVRACKCGVADACV
jgi:hypothetical protein